MEDYSKYLSYDNGCGILISKYDKEILDRYNINYDDIGDLKVLINSIYDCIDGDNEELDDVLNNLEEIYYYNYVNK